LPVAVLAHIEHTMNRLAQSLTGCAAAALALCAGTAIAAASSEAQLRYQQERAACLNGSSNQDRATCLREAGAALQEARRGGLASGAGELGPNRTTRCAALPPQDREDCVMRMSGQGSASGSAAQGGILRELERPVPARSN
jgi:hypothetical protein